MFKIFVLLSFSSPPLPFPPNLYDRQGESAESWCKVIKKNGEEQQNKEFFTKKSNFNPIYYVFSMKLRIFAVDLRDIVSSDKAGQVPCLEEETAC